MATPDLEFQIMTCLWIAYPGARHGWAIWNWLREHDIVVGQASVYRVLDRLQRKRWIQTRQGDKEESYAGGPRTYCSLTTKGIAEYPGLLSKMTKIAERMFTSARLAREKQADVGDAASG